MKTCFDGKGKMAFFTIFLALLLIPSTSYSSLSFDRTAIDLSIESDGKLHVLERYFVTFYSPMHGIYRKIPLVFTDLKHQEKRIKLKVVRIGYCDAKGRWSHWENWFTRGNLRNFSIYIGRKDSTITGKRCYWLEYYLDGVVVNLNKNRPSSTMCLALNGAPHCTT